MRTRCAQTIFAIAVLLVVMQCVCSAPQSSHTKAGGFGQDYLPNEIIVKFKGAVAETLKKEMSAGFGGRQLELSDSLNKLNSKFHLRDVKALFKNFKANRRRMQSLGQEDAAFLSKRERHILQRLKRAPKQAAIPALDRIYKLEFDLEGQQSIEEVLALYKGDPGVEYAELNYIVTIDATPNDPYFSFQWSLHNTGQMYPASGRYNKPPGTLDADIDAPEAWDIQTGSGNVIVAVADTGVDYDHRDLSNNMWTDSSGYHGYDFVNNDHYPMDDHGHGTHCAGVIAAEGNNGLDITGVCWNVKIMALKSLDETGSGIHDCAVAALYYGVNNGADVISNSWSSTIYSQTMQDAIDYAYSQGVVIVASAGNQNSSAYHYPANNNYVIAVAATNSLDEKASFSNFGDWVDIAAPGVDTLSLRASGSDAGTPYDSYTTIMSGTSMSCPHVAGACALLLTKNPALSVDNIYDILITKTDAIPEGICHSNGRINLRKAVKPVCFDRCYYRCSDEANITLVDFDRAGLPEVVIWVESDGGDYETVVLEVASRPWLFIATVSTESAEVVVEDGVLQVSHGQTITAGYEDPNDGSGNPATETDNAAIDCQSPVISNVQVETVTCMSTVITFETDEPSTARLRCGSSCGGQYTIIGTDRELTTNHSVVFEDLASGTDYCFVVDVNDIAGNQTTDDCNGLCYQFTSGDVPAEVHVPADYATIQEAIDSAIDCTIIVVADGVYRGSGNRDIDFKGKAITVRSANGPESCIIDCQGANRAFYFRNYEERKSILDGFTIANGYTAGKGGGIKCYIGSPTIRNCIISNCRAGEREEYHCGGAGIHSLYSNPGFINCIIKDNDGFNHGGMYIEAGNVDIINCVIVRNDADYVSHMGTYSYGGGICSQSSNVLIKNCLIADNWSSRTAGGLDCNRGWVQIINCTIVNNTAGVRYGGVSNLNESDITISNSIIWGNQAPDDPQLGGAVVSYSDVQDGYSGIGNIDLDPCFAEAAGGDYHLRSESGRWEPSSESWVQDALTISPCIDAGNPGCVLGDEPEDASNVRINMGAYGGTAEASKTTTGWRSIADLTNDWVVDFNDVEAFFGYWLQAGECIPGDLDRNRSVGLSDFAVMAGCWLADSIQPRRRARMPSPSDGATDVGLTVYLSWAGGFGALSHDVYFGTDYNDVNDAAQGSAEYVGNYGHSSYDPCGLSPETTYYWRIDEVGSSTTCRGDVWSFTTWAEVIPPDLVSWWRFDEGEGTIAYDSADRNHGIIHGATWTTGEINDALSFDGLDDYVEFSDDLSLRFNQYDSFSISFWVRPLSGGWILSKMRTGEQRGVFGYSATWEASTSRLRFSASKSWAGTTFVYSHSIAEGTWYHMTGVYDNKDMMMYINGELHDTRRFEYDTGDTEPDKHFVVGARSYDYTIEGYFGGEVDDLHVYDRALSGQEIRGLYGQAFMGECRRRED